jgi:hypothetical protein
MDDLLALVNAISAAAESGDHERTDRLLRLILEGITVGWCCDRITHDRRPEHRHLTKHY